MPVVVLGDEPLAPDASPKLNKHLMVTCPASRGRVRQERLETHLSSKCPNRPGGLSTQFAEKRQTTQQASRKSKARRRQAERVQPGSLIRTARNRTNKLHQSGEIALKAPRSSDKNSLRSKEAKIEIAAIVENIDATKNYGFPARESGRYGSHPSHDGFDDESKP